ncbi:MAG: polysaccharide pyruvyl transferase family protein [Paludibacter sp.]|nr:polysaccharide pyruvyl transferase family protein [Paludibacter sp.]
MKRIGLHTITDYVNYGNRLQNYAAQEVLKSFGFEVESVINYPTRPVEKGLSFTLNRIKNAFQQSPATLFDKLSKKIIERKQRPIYEACKRNKATSFKRFSDKYITESNFTLTLNNIPTGLNERYDYAVVGSDQIWNPNIRWGSPLDFLSYVSTRKRIALAPSIGVSSIPEKYQAKYRTYLDEMAFLSVREEKGAEIIRSLSGREAQVLVDPTLVLSTTAWNNIAQAAPNKPSKKYLLTYFIGEVSKNRLNTLKQLATKNNLELVMLNSLHDTNRFAADPAEFLDYIRSASLVCTDSFHCIIFSMHFCSPFVVFDREGKSAPMSSRIDTLLKKFNFEQRKQNLLEINNQYFDINFDHVNTIMETERNKVMLYLKNALN